MWQTDLADFKLIGWGWLYLSTILDDFSRYIIVWKPCTTMPAEDVTETLKLAREASGGYHADVVHKAPAMSRLETEFFPRPVSGHPGIDRPTTTTIPDDGLNGGKDEMTMGEVCPVEAKPKRNRCQRPSGGRKAGPQGENTVLGARGTSSAVIRVEFEDHLGNVG